MADDIIHGFIRRLQELHPDTPRGEVSRVEQELRREWGGARVYVPKASAESRVNRLAEAIAHGVSIQEAMKLAGVSRRIAYRLLNRRRPRR